MDTAVVLSVAQTPHAGPGCLPGGHRWAPVDAEGLSGDFWDNQRCACGERILRRCVCACGHSHLRSEPV